MRVSELRFLLYAAAFAATLTTMSCQDSGIVGSSFTTTGQTIIVDTLKVGAVTSLDLTDYSGDLANFSAGQYQDPLFGSFHATAVLAPGLPSATRIIGNIENVYLVLHPAVIYGDSMSTATFDVMEIGARWRGANWRLNDQPELTGNVLGSFEVGPGVDSVAIELPGAWIDNYSLYFASQEGINRDSLFRANIFGFAIIPTSGDKVVGFRAVELSDVALVDLVRSYLHVISDEVEDGFNIFNRAWAYSLDYDMSSATLPIPENATPVFNIFKNAAELDFQISETILETKNVSRVEFVLYEDTLSLRNSLPPGHTRPKSNRTFIYRLSPGEKDYAIVRGPDDNIVRTAADATYRFNLLGYTNEILFGTPRDINFVATSGQNNGLIYPNLIYNAHETEFFPKIIVTKVIPESL